MDYLSTNLELRVYKNTLILGFIWVRRNMFSRELRNVNLLVSCMLHVKFYLRYELRWVFCQLNWSMGFGEEKLIDVSKGISGLKNIVGERKWCYVPRNWSILSCLNSLTDSFIPNISTFWRDLFLDKKEC